MLASAKHMCGYDQGLAAECVTEKKKMKIGIKYTQEGIGYETWALGERNAYLKGNYKSLCRMWVAWVQNGEMATSSDCQFSPSWEQAGYCAKIARQQKGESSYESAGFGFSAKLE
jgi:hypothetical protein